MRRSELLGLRWRDLDLLLGSISVSQVTHRLQGARTVYEDPKSAKGKRYISMPPSLTITLSEHRQRQAALRESVGSVLDLDDLVFTWPDGRPMLPDSLTHAFAKVAAKAGLADVHLFVMGQTGGTPARTRTGAYGLGNRCSIRLSYRGTQSID